MDYNKGKVMHDLLTGRKKVIRKGELVLLVPRKGYGALCIEMKTPAGELSQAQRRWQQAVTEVGQKYVVCRTIEDFVREVNRYLKG